MSARQHTRDRSTSFTSSQSFRSRPTPPPVSLTPENIDADFEPCAATASFFLYAQRNLILVLHHDTLAIERRFDLHQEEVVWIIVDNTSERGSGRLAVSYDKGSTAIVWDILTGQEVSRFSAYEHMKVASFMRNGNIAFGNDQGNIVLFEPSTSEHISARTIFDPITALAPGADSRTFAIGGLAWHGSSSKQKTEMLATQTGDGDLRVWSIPKTPQQDPPSIIRVLQRTESQVPGPCWMAWSKNGRIVQHAEGETRSWDVRTKKVTYEIIPTVEGTVAVTSYGATATLFTLGRNHTVQQYDISPNNPPMQVASVQHVPSNTPPTPPTTLVERKKPQAESRAVAPAGASAATLNPDQGSSSADESAGVMSPLQKIANEMETLDALESELRDHVTPLSPTSTRESSVSSRSSGQSRRRMRKYLYDRPQSSRNSSTTGFDDRTEFSFGGPTSIRPGHESMSIRSVSSFQSRPYDRGSGLRKEILRSPDEAHQTQIMDLFPYTKARMRDVAFRTPHYGSAARTPELLQREMLSVVFGWNDTIQSLIRDELMRHRPGSAAGVLLAKWLGDLGADDMASMIGSESMTSSDWMLLALSSIGADSQKKVGEAFVQRLLEKGDVHPAVAILLGLGEYNDAIEVYVSQLYWIEAVLLTALVTPADWGRQSYLIRKWGEHAVQQGQAELAVRCFSCTSIETSEPWFSPRAQDAAYSAAQERMTGPLSAGATSPPNSPPSRTASGRLTAKNASLKLITDFGIQTALNAAMTNDATPMVVGSTPIAESAISSINHSQPWRTRASREPSTARTATPGENTRRKRLPSRSDIERAKQEAAELATPQTAARDGTVRRPPGAAGHTRHTSTASSNNAEPTTALRPTVFGGARPIDDHLPSPAQGVFSRFRERSHSRATTHDRNPSGLAVQVFETRYDANALSPAPTTGESESRTNNTSTQSRGGAPSPPLTGNSSKGRAVEEYISSVDQARSIAREERAASRRRDGSRRRTESRSGRASSQVRERSQTRGADVRHVKPAKRSPSSPVPMSPEEVAQASTGFPGVVEPATIDDESFYKITSPVESHRSGRSAALERSDRRALSPDRERAHSRARSQQRRPSGDANATQPARSPSVPLPRERKNSVADAEYDPPGQRDVTRSRARSTNHRADDDLQSRRAISRTRRDDSAGRRPSIPEEPSQPPAGPDPDVASIGSRTRREPRVMTRKQLAARELEERRLSLARRPSAPAIPLPGEPVPSFGRPKLSPRSQTDLSQGLQPVPPPLSRAHTVDPEAMSKYNAAASAKLPPMGLPATPRAMRHPRYMSADPNDRDAPAVPEIPGNFSELSSLSSGVTGSNLSQVTGSNLSALSTETRQEENDNVGDLLPSTVFGQKVTQAPPRSMSAPPESSANVHPAYQPNVQSSQRGRGSRGHFMKISPPDATHATTTQPAITSIDEALHGDQQIVILDEEAEDVAPLLPELQHLAGPPVPPPPPTMYHQGVINIAMDENGPAGAMDPSGSLGPYSMERAGTASPPMIRKGRGSTSETFSSRFRGVTEKMRSSSRSRTKSPSISEAYRPSPYESVLPPVPYQHSRHESLVRAKSPYEQAMAAAQLSENNPTSVGMLPPPPPPPPPGRLGDSRFSETAIPPTQFPGRSHSSQDGYRSPQEIRAAMSPEMLQPGVYRDNFL